MGDLKATQVKNMTVTRQERSAIASKSSLHAPPTHPMLRLQRQIGNQAVTQLIQAKLKVGKPNDTYEMEADRVADTVMRMPDSLVQRQTEEKKEETAQTKPDFGQISPVVQRQAAEEKKEETAQMKPAIEPITPFVQRQTEEKKEEPVQTLQRQTEEKKDEPVQTLQRQTEEKKDEPVQTLQRQTEEKKDEPVQTLQRQTEEKKDEPVQTLQRQTEEKKDEPVQTLQRQTEEKKDEPVQTKTAVDSTSEVATDVESRIQTMREGGRPLPDSTRSFFESRFGYDFSGVRVHTDSQADDISRKLNAQAFTIGPNVFFAGGRYEPHTTQGKWLLAHELTHTVQQQSSQPLAANPPTVQSHPETTTPSSIAVSTASPQVQRIFGIEIPGIDTVRNWAADRAANIPGFTLLTVILGRNPINNRPVDRNAVNLIRGALGLIPGGEVIFQGLQASGAIDRVATWLQQQIAQLNISWEGIMALLRQAWDAISITDPSGSIDRVINVFRPTLDRIRAFASSVGSRVIQFIKEAILRPVGQFAQQLPFYPLLTVILGKDPITDEVVQRNATNVIRGILLILPGGEEKFQNLQQSGIIDRAYNWFNEQLTRLNLTWNYIKSIFVRLWETLSINDLLSPSAAFERIRNIFSEPVQRITAFAGAAIRKVAEFIFEGVLTLAGGLGRQVLGIFNRARSVFSTIIENPVGFVGNLIGAVRRGFQQFSSNILTHLQAGLIGWLFGALQGAGLQLPERFDLQGIVSIVMQILGLTYQRLRGILVRLIGEERVSQAEQVFDFLVTLVRDGIAAAWERIVEFAGNLQEMVIGGIRDWVARSVIGAAITRLISMFNPAGAVIQAIMAAYNTVVFFIERAQQIAALAEAVFESIANIASGNISAAANYVERTMARTLPVAISFLARLIGLGNVSEQIRNIIQRIQSPIENAMNRVANFIVSRVRGLLSRERGVRDSQSETATDVRGQARSMLAERLRSGHPTKEQVEGLVRQIHEQLRPQGLRRLEIGARNENNEYSIIAEASPPHEIGKLVEEYAPEGRQVVMDITLDLAGESAMEGADFRFSRELNQETGEMAAVPTTFVFDPTSSISRPRGYRGSVRSTRSEYVPGGVVVPPAPQSSSIELVTWNTGDLVRDTNVSHAERQFKEWFSNRPLPWRQRVRRINARITKFSPCTQCVSDLIRVINLAPDVQRQRSAYLTFYELFDRGEFRTTDSALAQLRDEGWNVEIRSRHEAPPELVAVMRQ